MDDSYIVSSLPGRNRVFRVAAPSHSGLVIKQHMGGENPEVRYATESSAFKLLNHTIEAAPVIELIAEDPSCRCLVFKNIRGLNAQQLLVNSTSDSIVQLLGLLLSALRQWRRCTQRAEIRDSDEFRNAMPPILLGADDFVQSLRATSIAQSRIAEFIVGEAGFHSLFCAANSMWHQRDVIHGDIKLSNFVGQADGSLHLVDLETCGLGDMAWDVAGVVQSLVVEASLRMFADSSYRNLDMVQHLEVGQEYLRREMLGLSSDWSDSELVSRVRAYTCVRLIQSALEIDQYESQVTDVSAGLIQAACNLWEDEDQF